MNLTVSFFINGHIRESKQVTTPCTIGRSSQADWFLTHPMLSRKHCSLFDKEGKLYLCDEGSLNGVQFKGMPVKEPVRLQVEDEFSVGLDLKFRVSAPAEEDPVTDKVEFAGQTTVVYFRDDMDSRQSTLMVKEQEVLE